KVGEHPPHRRDLCPPPLSIRHFHSEYDLRNQLTQHPLPRNGCRVEELRSRRVDEEACVLYNAQLVASESEKCERSELPRSRHRSRRFRPRLVPEPDASSLVPGECSAKGIIEERRRSRHNSIDPCQVQRSL